jgi:hypothetical protein
MPITWHIETPKRPRTVSYPLEWTGRVLLKGYSALRCCVVLALADGSRVVIWFMGKDINQMFYYHLIELGETITIKGRKKAKELRGGELYLMPGADADELRTKTASDRTQWEFLTPETEYIEKLPEYDQKPKRNSKGGAK